MSPVSFEGGYCLQIPLGERWRIGRRLVELGIPAVCTKEGHLQVQVDTPLALLQVRSVIRQHMARRQELLEELEACWRLSREGRGEGGQVG
ncbi:Asr1405/Asl0597 family protein [Synechococcus sp. H65.1]|uniref:Asr1405/Asl0597 family protein n=2 Tax=Synechococcus TaxID=1129 RepID=UPI0039C4B5CE